jgi:hypothetical protein
MNEMKKGICLIGIIVLITCIILSGCQQTNSVKTQKIPQNVFLDSTIVEFVNVTFEKEYNKTGGLQAVVVGWMFHNIAGKTISAKIDVKFYDKNNNFLYNESRYISHMPAGYTEQSFSPGANRVVYDKAGATLVDHVVISVTEM